MFNAYQTKELQAPLNRSHVKERAQAGRKFSYVEGWHAIAEANRIFGFDAWDRETVELRQLGEPREVEGKFRVAYLARVRVTVRTDGSAVTIREGCGYGSGIDRDLGSAHESAIKEAETDAMKRALMTFGNPFGLALYDKDQAGVVDDAPRPAATVQPIQAPTERAKKWAEMAMVKIPTFKTGREFDEWHKENRDTIAKVKDYDAPAHAKLLAAINAALAKYNPIGA